MRDLELNIIGLDPCWFCPYLWAVREAGFVWACFAVDRLLFRRAQMNI